MKKLDRIAIEPVNLSGQPCIRGMRISLRPVLDMLATYPDRKDLFANFSELKEEHFRWALAYAALSLPDSVVELVDAR